jgi:hypothetical protein
MQKYGSAQRYLLLQLFGGFNVQRRYSRHDRQKTADFRNVDPMYVDPHMGTHFYPALNVHSASSSWYFSA